MKSETVGLVGYGRFGRMAYEYLSRRQTVGVYDSDPVRIKGLSAAVSFRELAACRWIVLCVPISEIRRTCREMSSLVGEGQVVIDTCSVKQKPLEWMREELPPSVELLGTHPLFGPDSGKEGITGLKMVLCPERIGRETYLQVRNYLESLRLVLIETTAEEHDRQIAESQAIFHLIAQTMKRLSWGGQAISTPGPEAFYRLVKSVQNDTEQLFVDMERENPYASPCRRRFIEELLRLDKDLDRSRS